MSWRIGVLAFAIFAVVGFLSSTVPQAYASTCATGALDGSFASSPMSGSISAGETDCYTLPNVSAGDRITVGFQRSSSSGSWTVRDGNGDAICSGSSTSDSCSISGAANWSVEVGGAGTFSYSLVARRLSDPQGCSSLGDPEVWSFTAPRLNGSIEGSLDARCYTFSRESGEADGSYWFRAVRTSGSLSPYWHVYSPSGSQECSGYYYSSGPDNCRLLTSGQFVLVVDDSSHEQSGSFFVTANRLSSPEGCTALPSISFEAAPTSGSLSTGGETDCYTLPEVSAGDKIAVGLDSSGASGASPHWAVIDGNGDSICSSSSYSDTCSISGAGEWSVLVYDSNGAGTFSYSLVARRLSDPQGCSSLGDPEVWSFTAPRLNGSIEGSLDARCYTFSRESGEADGSYWFRAVRTSGSLSPYWHVYSPSGSQECSGYYYSSGPDNCRLLTSGQFVLVVDDSSHEQSGSFFVTANRLSSPEGCTALPSISFEAAPTSGSLSTGGETDCYTLPEVSAGDKIAVGLDSSGASGASPHWAVIDGNGDSICSSSSYSDTCSISGAGEWSVLVYDSNGAGTFSYSLVARRLSDPQGCSSLGDPEVWSFTAPRLNGSIEGSLDARCYTFSRESGEADGSYWFRAVRTSGSLSPYWHVYSPSGSQECSGYYYSSGPDNCRLLTSGQFVLVVDDSSHEQSGSFFVTANRLSSPEGCTALPSISFEAAPTSGSLSTGGETDCYTLPEVSAGDKIAVGLDSSGASGASPHWAVIDGNGDSICSSSSYSDTCSISGAGEWSVLVYDSNGAGTFSYSLVARRLSDPQGCSSLGDPEVWSFTAPRLNGSIEGSLDARCYTFSRESGEADGSYWFRVMRASGSLSPRWNVYGPSGQRECSGYNSGPEAECHLLTAGHFALVIDDSSQNQSGSFLATAKRLNLPTGCASLPNISSGIPSTLGNLLTAGEIDCYTLPASADDRFKIELTGTADQFAVIDPDGETQCLTYYTPCTLSSDGTHALLVYSSSVNAGSYRIEAACENPPCGETETAVSSSTPTHVGQSKFTTLLLRGHDLDLLEEVTLSKGAQDIKGSIQEPSKDARAVDVRFNLEDAPTGSWTLSAHFVDGSTRTLASGIVLEAAHEATLSVETVGRSSIRVGVPTPVSVVVHNSGNVDATAVPVVLRGLPAGATLAPAFDTYTPEGGPGGVSMTKLSYDQASETVSEDGEVIAPFMLARVPAGRSLSMDFMITVPTASSYGLRALVGRCLATTVASSVSSPSVLAASSTPSTEAVTCAGDVAKTIAGAALDALPLSSCAAAASNVVIDGVAAANGGEGFWSWSHALSWAADGAWCLGEVFVPESKLVKVALDVGSTASGVIGDVGTISDCMFFASQALLAQQSLISVDPNELEGPTGVGTEHYIQANSPLTYKVLFENLSSAGAAAETIKIRDHLDTGTFKPSSVLFAGIRFGNTHYVLPYPSPLLDETFDLRPNVNAKVHVTASVTGDELEAELVATDPDTLETPLDPEIGVLPPNHEPPEGEGELLFTVEPQPLVSGATIANSASIQFDSNEPIVTPTWTNTVDKQAPVPTVAASPEPAPLSADVSWGGTDDAAGINLWRLEVSENGGPFQLWHTAVSPSHATYEASVAGNYSFRAVAYDGAGNVGQSTISGVTLQATNELSIERAGSGSGTIESSPAGIECGSTCAAAFVHGAHVVLNANPDPGSHFSGWSGAGCAGTASCEVTLTSDEVITANFDTSAVPTDAEANAGSTAETQPASQGSNEEPEPVPGVGVAGRIALVKGKLAQLAVRCVGAGPCRGVAKLLSKVKVKRGNKRRPKGKHLMLVGIGRFNVAASKRGVIRIRLTGLGRRLMRTAGKAGIPAQLVGTGLKQRTVRLRLAVQKTGRG